MPIKRGDVIEVNDSFETFNINDVFLGYRISLVEALVRSLESVGRVSSGVLAQSINVDIEQRGRVLSFELKMEDYWKFVEEGRRKGAKQPPQAAMLEFVKLRGIYPKNKNIKGRGKKLQREKAFKQLAYVMGRSISKKGIKPTHFYSNVVNDSFKKQFIKDVTMALKEDVFVTIKDIKDSLNG